MTFTLRNHYAQEAAGRLKGLARRAGVEVTSFNDVGADIEDIINYTIRATLEEFQKRLEAILEDRGEITRDDLRTSLRTDNEKTDTTDERPALTDKRGQGRLL